MEYVVFLALALSIFGSALAAMSALRSHYEKELFDSFPEGRKLIEEIESNGGETVDAKKDFKQMAGWKRAWSCFQWLPIALFVIVIGTVVWQVNRGC